MFTCTLTRSATTTKGSVHLYYFCELLLLFPSGHCKLSLAYDRIRKVSPEKQWNIQKSLYNDGGQPEERKAAAVSSNSLSVDSPSCPSDVLDINQLTIKDWNFGHFHRKLCYIHHKSWHIKDTTASTILKGWFLFLNKSELKECVSSENETFVITSMFHRYVVPNLSLFCTFF